MSTRNIVKLIAELKSTLSSAQAEEIEQCLSPSQFEIFTEVLEQEEKDEAIKSIRKLYKCIYKDMNTAKELFDIMNDRQKDIVIKLISSVP